MNDVNWDDLKLFHIVASEGGLAAAAGQTGISAPTIGRRMLFLERTMGRTLFIRSQQGYRLAPDGIKLLERVNSMRSTASEISQWHGDAFSLPIVSIGSNIWMMGFIANNAHSLRGPQDAFRLCCKLLGTDHAYRAENRLGEKNLPWVSIGTEVATSDAEKWVFRHHEHMIQTWTNAPELLPKLIASGAGRGVLPSYIGDRLEGIVRDGEALEALSHTLWLVFNDDDRHSPEMRLLIDRLAALLKHNETLFEGRPESDNRSEASIIAFPRS